jgi:hypothetical protein
MEFNFDTNGDIWASTLATIGEISDSTLFIEGDIEL